MPEDMNEDADHQLVDTLFGTLVRPKRTFEGLANRTSSKPGASAIAVLGMFWGLFALLLWTSGRTPHAILVPIPAELYYLAEGLLMLPILTGLWWVFGEVAHRVAGGAGSEPAVRTALGFAYAVPMMVHIGVEMLAYLFFGFDRLADVSKISLPLASLWVLALSALALRVLHRVSRGRAILAALAGLLVQAIAGALVLR